MVNEFKPSVLKRAHSWFVFSKDESIKGSSIFDPPRLDNDAISVPLPVD
jgi:hypothetical protein